MKPLYLAAFLMLSSPAVAQTSEDYSKMSRKTWSLFECAILAAYTRNNSEAERLFLLGYETGKIFVEAVKAGKVQPEDLRSQMPWSMGEKLNGLSTEFALGRIYESIQGYTIDEIWKGAGSEEEAQKLRRLPHTISRIVRSLNDLRL